MQCYKRSDQALHSEIGGDIVALNIHRGECFGMENVSADVWRLLAEPVDLDALCNALIDLYDVEDGRCHDEVGGLLMEMIEAGLVEPI